jgi:hypothetical protein
MLSRVAGSLLRQSGLMRGISTSAARLQEEAAPAGVKEFTEAFVKFAPSTMNPPEFPSQFLPEEAARDSAADGEQFPVNFFTPNGAIAEGKVRTGRARSGVWGGVRRSVGRRREGRARAGRG